MRRLAFLALAALLATPAAAGWVVMKDGTTVATKGPWTISGNTIQFNDNLGRLNSLPLRDIDIPATSEVTVKALPDSGLTEVKTIPSPVYDVEVAEDGTALRYVGHLFAISIPVYAIRVVDNGRAEVGADCLDGRIVAVRSGVSYLVQIGTRIEKLRPLGLQSADAASARSLIGGGWVCLANDARIPFRSPVGEIQAYVLLPGSRDLGYELMAREEAQISGERFEGRAQYLAASSHAAIDRLVNGE